MAANSASRVRGVGRNVGLGASHIAQGGDGAGLKNVAVPSVEVRGVDALGADKLKVRRRLLSVHSELDHLSREGCNLVPLVVDERLEGEVNPRTVLVRGEPLLALPVLEGRVRGQLGNAGKAHRARLPTVLPVQHRGVRQKLVQPARTEVVKLEVRGKRAVHRLSLRVLLLKLSVDNLPHEVRNVVSGDGLPQESLRDRKSTRLNSSHVATS